MSESDGKIDCLAVRLPRWLFALKAGRSKFAAARYRLKPLGAAKHGVIPHAFALCHGTAAHLLLSRARKSRSISADVIDEPPFPSTSLTILANSLWFTEPAVSSRGSQHHGDGADWQAAEVFDRNDVILHPAACAANGIDLSLNMTRQGTPESCFDLYR